MKAKSWKVFGVVTLGVGVAAFAFTYNEDVTISSTYKLISNEVRANTDTLFLVTAGSGNQDMVLDPRAQSGQSALVRLFRYTSGSASQAKLLILDPGTSYYSIALDAQTGGGEFTGDLAVNGTVAVGTTGASISADGGDFVIELGSQ